MNLSDTTVIQLKLGLETSIDDLKQMIEAAGRKRARKFESLIVWKPVYQVLTLLSPPLPLKYRLCHEDISLNGNGKLSQAATDAITYI